MTVVDGCPGTRALLATNHDGQHRQYASEKSTPVQQHPMALKYRLAALGWYNFETLSQTLLKALIGPGVTSFGGTQDGGRDAAFKGEAAYPSTSTRWSGTWTFQVKSSDAEDEGERRGAGTVLTEFRKEVRSIVARRRCWPDNYILVTNVALTARARTLLHEAIAEEGFCGNFAAIDGHEVCELLDIYPQVRFSYPQLIGLADVRRLLNQDVLARSEAFVGVWQPRLATFAAVGAYFDALRALREHSFVVLDGAPEMGKSFIGAALALSHVCDGHEAYFINSPSEFFKLFDKSRQQVFFADDAVGQITFDPDLGNQWARDLPGVVVRLTGKHLLIWTARSYILNEALAQTKLQENDPGFPGVREVTVNVGTFTQMERALILYNHAKASRLPANARAIVRELARWITVHPGYTPLRARQLVNDVLPSVVISRGEQGSVRVRAEVDAFLSNPSDSFRRAYQALGESERTLAISLLDAGTRPTLQELKRIYEERTLGI